MQTVTYILLNSTRQTLIIAPGVRGVLMINIGMYSTMRIIVFHNHLPSQKVSFGLTLPITLRNVSI